MTGPTRWFALLALLGLSGCTVTRALWREPDSETMPDRVEVVPLEVVAVHGEIQPDPAATRLELLLVRPDAGTGIGHVRRWTQRDPGCIVLEPSPFERDWLFAAHDDLAVESWDVQVFGGDAFRARGSFNARVTLIGTMPGDALGQFLDSPVRAPEPFLENTLPDRWESDALAALEQHDWSQLLGGRSATAQPIAWLDADGTTHAIAPRDHNPADFDLVVEFRSDDGSSRQAKIPASVLTGSFEQQLAREDDRIHWRYSAVWTARHTSPTDAPTFLVGTGPDRIAYEWSYKVPDPGPPAISIVAKVGLTPFAIALDAIDFVIETSPPLRRLKDFLLDRDRAEPDPIPPIESLR